MRGVDATLARYMSESLSIPTATSFRTIAVDTLDGRRRQLNEALKVARRDLKVSFTHLIGYAIATADRDHPDMRPLVPARWTASRTASCPSTSTSGSRSTCSARTARAR